MVAHFIQECTKFSELYEGRFLEEAKQDCPDLETDPWDSLRFFLMYAFARQGSSSDYSFAAIDTIKEFSGSPITSVDSNKVWLVFSNKLKNESLNHKNNPMCPKNTEYEKILKGKKITLKVNGFSIIEVIKHNLEDESLVTWFKNLLELDKVRQAYDMLKTVNGIGDKIASFFLRDVAIIYNIAPKKDRALLQPVDTWIRFAVHSLSKNNRLSDNECASFIVNNSSEPEKANPGIWYFCAEIAGSSKFQVRLSMKNKDFMNSLTKQHLENLIRSSKAANKFIYIYK